MMKLNLILIYIILTCVSVVIISHKLIDSTSFIVKIITQDNIEDGLIDLKNKDYDKALPKFIYSYEVNKLSYTAYNIAYCYKKLNNDIENKNWYNQYLILSELQFKYRKKYSKKYTYLMELMQLGIGNHIKNNYEIAINYYLQVIDIDPFYVDSWYNLGVSSQFSGSIQRSAKYYALCLHRDPFHVKARINLATLHHMYGKLSEAIYHYYIVIESFLKDKFSFDDTQHTVYSREYIMSKLNLGAALLQYNNLDEAAFELKTLISHVNDLIIDNCIDINTRENKHINEEVIILSHHIDLYNLCGQDRDVYLCDTCQYYRNSQGSALSHLSKVFNAGVYFLNYEIRMYLLLKDTMDNIKMGLSVPGPMLPFDTLMNPISLNDKLIIAKAASKIILPPIIVNNNNIIINNNNNNNKPKIKIGFISFDFNDHPTAHLVEAIYDVINKSRKINCFNDINNGVVNNEKIYCNIELTTYNYGKDDNSSYRHQLVKLSDKFVDLISESHLESYNIIKSDKIDILLDMQLHTLGNRLQIIAGKPCNLQINYLVYPGTSGASFLNHIIVDQYVVPPEQSKYYSESLIVLPSTYQISTYTRHMVDDYNEFDQMVNMLINKELRSYERQLAGLPNGKEDIIICNFNKIDKIDYKSFKVWLDIMLRLPTSYLWLLEPTISHEGKNIKNILRNNEIVKDNLINFALSNGILSHRLLFAKRVSKTEHIKRHILADLFVDTFVYGAHSTATDALRGGLPVLSIEGDSFPSRVVSSLYSSFKYDITNKNYPIMDLSNLLVCTSVKEFTNIAYNLLQPISQISKNILLLDKIRIQIALLIKNKLGLFNTARSVSSFLYGIHAAYEITEKERRLSNKNKSMHIIIFDR